MSLSIQHISKSYGNTVVLNDLNIEIKKGEIVGLLGKNGAGKTTLLKIISSIIAPDEGACQVNKIDTRDRKKYQKSIGYLSERNPLYIDMYVKEYLWWCAGLYKLPNSKARTEEIIQSMSLTDRQDYKIKKLSKGYRQRLGMAAAILHDPDVLVLDEPINGLDPAQIIQFRKSIKLLAKSKTIILSSHLMQEIEALCTRYILLEGGVIKKDELLKNELTIESKYWWLNTAELLSAQDLQILDKAMSIKVLDEKKYQISSKNKNDPRKELLYYLAANNNYLLNLREGKEDLGQLFKEA